MTRVLVQTIRTRPEWRGPAITAIKSVHTLIFLAEASCVFYVLYSGITGRFSLLTQLSLVVMVFEGVALLLNRGRCPLTTLAEDLGSEHGSVSDIFLPTWFTPHIPIVFSTLLGLGIAGLGLHWLM